MDCYRLRSWKCTEGATPDSGVQLFLLRNLGVNIRFWSVIGQFLKRIADCILRVRLHPNRQVLYEKSETIYYCRGYF